MTGIIAGTNQGQPKSVNYKPWGSSEEKVTLRMRDLCPATNLMT
jgi:hypothetical protein